MTCYSQHLETSNQKTDAILDENGNVKHGQETVSSAIPEKHEQGSITVIPETLESGEYHQEEPHEPEESQHAIPSGKDEESQLLSEGNCTSVIF